MDEYDKMIDEILRGLLTPEMVEAEARRRLVVRIEARYKMIARDINRAAVKAKEKEKDEKLVKFLKNMGLEKV